MNTLTVTLVQADLAWEDKDANLRKFTRIIEGITDKTELIVLPEMFSTGFSMNPERLAETMEGETVCWLKEIAARKGAIVAGSLMIEEGGHYFNRLVWMLPNGNYGFYDKRHLFCYAGEDKHYSRGDTRLIASVKGWRVNLQVCYDLRFPVWARQQKSDHEGPEYDVLLYVANWPERRNHAWKSLLTARAIENQCYVVGVNRVGNDGNQIYHSGDSMVLSPLGEVLHHVADKEEVYTITLQKQTLETVREKFPFWRDADSFTIY